MMATKGLRNTLISIFVIIWTVTFHYESIRYFYLNPMLKTELPKVKFLFPPAGWIMFFRVDDQFGHAEVYGVTKGSPQAIDPHHIFATRTILFDNIHRNILSRVTHASMQKPFCEYLERKFPAYDNFYITAIYYPSITKTPQDRLQRVMYQCE